MKVEWTNRDNLSVETTSPNSKAVLVIDMPSSCVMCEIRWSCKIWNKWKGYNDRLDGCPLRPLPPKLDANDWHRMFSGLFSEREAKGYGWNVCLDVITGETE